MLIDSVILNKITHIAQGKLLYRIVGQNMGGMFFSDRDSVERIAKDMGVSSAYITKMLKELVDLGILIKKSRGFYQINIL